METLPNWPHEQLAVARLSILVGNNYQKFDMHGVSQIAIHDNSSAPVPQYVTRHNIVQLVDNELPI
jgi:hypothetical protein